MLHDFSAADLNCLVESKLLSPQESDDSLKGAKSPAGEFAPVLGVLVHATEVWQQARRATNAPVIHLSAPPMQPAAYAAWIDLAIDRHEQSDGLWRGFAAQCLADCADGADTVIDSWASLRTLGQQRFADPPRAAMPLLVFRWPDDTFIQE